MRKEFLLAGVSAMIVGLGAAAATAQEYPTQRVSVIVSFSPGGATDILARYLSDRLSNHFDATFVVDNQAGAGGRRGTQIAAGSDPDGYTLFLGQVSSHGVAPPLYGEDVGYDPLGDFTPIALISASPQVMVVRADSGFETLADFMAEASAEPMLYGSSGIGTTVHLSGELFNMMADTELQHIPYAGSGPAKTALQSGEVDVLFDDLPSSISEIRSGTFRALAVTVADRNPSIPDVPTLSEIGGEFGLEGFDASAWFVLAAPAGLDSEITETLNSAVNEILAQEDVIEFFSNTGSVTMGGTPEDARAHIEAELEKWGQVISEAGITLE